MEFITRWCCAEDELQRLNTELKEANAAKDQFVAMISHELRSPLSAPGSRLRLAKTARLFRK